MHFSFGTYEGEGRRVSRDCNLWNKRELLHKFENKEEDEEVFETGAICCC